MVHAVGCDGAARGRLRDEPIVKIIATPGSAYMSADKGLVDTGVVEIDGVVRAGHCLGNSRMPHQEAGLKSRIKSIFSFDKIFEG